jgi:small-conductance mechanosensitive channel
LFPQTNRFDHEQIGTDMKTALRYLLQVSLIGGLVFTWSFPPQRAFAQEQQAPSQESEQPQVQPIPAAEIPGRSEETAQVLQSIERRLQKSADLARIDSLLPDYVTMLRTERKNVTKRFLDRQTLLTLNDKKGEWGRFTRQLADWRSTIESRARELEDIRSNLQEMRTEWEVTRSASQEQELPAALRTAIRSVLQGLSEGETLLLASRTDVLALLKRVSDESRRSSESLRLIELAIAGFTEKLFQKDSPALWDYLTDTEERPEAEEISAINERKLEVLQQFFQDNVSPLAVHLVGAMFLLALLYVLRGKSSSLLAADSSAVAREVPLVLQRPISTTVVITLLITRLTFPDAPSYFYQLLGIALLPPIIRLLPLYVPPLYRRVFYVLIGLYVFHRLEGLSIDIPTLYRFLLLTLTILAVAALLWFELSVLRRPIEPQAPRRRWLAVLSRGALILISASLIGNIAGYVALSELLTDATLNSLYSIMALTAGVLVFGDLFDVILRSAAAQTVRSVREARDVLSKQWSRALRLIAVVAWLLLTLSNFNLAIPVRTFVSEELAHEWTIGTVTFTLGNILAFVLTIWLSVLLSRFLRFALNTDVLPRTNLRRGARSTVSTMIYYVVLLTGLLLAVSIIGIKWESLAIIIGALGVGIGFGLQNLVNNVVSGLILMFERPINVGDTIEFGSRFGDVLRIGLRASTVRTFDGSEVIVPNASLVSSEVVNWTLSDRNRRMEISVGVEYGTDPQVVLDLLLRVIGGHPKVMKRPEPFAWFMGFGDSSLDFVVKFWCQFEDAYTTRSDLMAGINQALNEAGITIPFPQRDLHVRSVDPSVKHSMASRKDDKH